MIRFNCDYSEGAHPRVLEKLTATNLEQTPAYGEDAYCRQAAGLIRQKCGRQDVDVHFLVGGTQTNLTLISAALRPHQGVIASELGHINVHESGAIEATGHKVLSLPAREGKIRADQIQSLYDAHWADETHEHMVQPGMVYLSNPTELGTVYSRAELTAISRLCQKNGLLLYVDGARLGYALCAERADIDLAAMTELCDAFYIGGTKLGALFGEALVIRNEPLKKDFRYIQKQRGGVLAKGRLLGLQFAALFEEDLYFDIARHANGLALSIRDACRQKGFAFLTPSPTNQQFPILPDSLLRRLSEKYAFAFWQKMDEEHSAVRFCTGWATTEEAVRALCADILKA
jgi:threonine aldolase